MNVFKIVVLSALLLTLPGCKKKAPSAPSGTTRAEQRADADSQQGDKAIDEDAGSAVEANAGAADIQANVEDLYGSWKLDPDATLAQVPEEHRDRARDFIQKLRVGIVFRKDGTLVLRVDGGKHSVRSGTFEVERAAGNTLILKATRNAIDAKDADGEASASDAAYTTTMKAIFFDRDHIHFVEDADGEAGSEPGPRNTMVFQRTTAEGLDAFIAGDADGEPAEDSERVDDAEPHDAKNVDTPGDAGETVPQNAP